MDVAEPAPREDASADQHETFCDYLAKQLTANEGFVVGALAEAHDIAEQSDQLLSFTDGNSYIIIGLIDREAHPDKAFTLSAARIRDIAEACRLSPARNTETPVTINLMEVGDTSSDQTARLAEIKPRFLDNPISAWIIDPQRATVWTTAGWRSRALRGFIRKLLHGPREHVAASAPVAVAPHAFPWVTAAIIAVLLAVFAAEIVLGVGTVSKHEQPTTATLVALGGLMGSLVIGAGEWYRLFTAPLLHGGLEHIALNAISLAVAGYVLEPLIGRAWFAALFVGGALSGAVFSLTFNPSNIVAVGASGAGMALFACMLVLSRRFPKGAARRQLQMNALYVLIPSLLPLTSLFQAVRVDYAAHFGGALGGAAVGFMLLALWRADEARPRLRMLAAAVAVAGFASFTAAGALARQNYPVYELSAALAPPAEMPASEEAARRQSADLVARYPRDPRAQFLQAVTLIRARDLEGAEQALRAALAEEALWRRAITGGDLPERTHALLALVLSDRGRNDEARETARPACALAPSNALRTTLDQAKLCGN